MPRDSAAADRPASYLVGTAAAFPLFFRDRTEPINQLPFSPSAKFPKSGSSCESRANSGQAGLHPPTDADPLPRREPLAGAAGGSRWREPLAGAAGGSRKVELAV